MKRLVLTLTIVLSLISFNSFANPGEVTPAALQSFNSSFKNATEVNWTVSDSYFKAYFSLNGQYVTAYYGEEGKMLGLTSNISSLQLPITLQSSLKNNYEGYWITDLFEMANEDGTSYYVTLENADSKLVLKSVSNISWSNFKKQRKS